MRRSYILGGGTALVLYGALKSITDHSQVMNTGFEHSTTSKFSERFDKTESDGSSQDTPTSKNVNEMPWNLAWPKCDLEAPHVIYAAANPDRATTIRQTIADIGGCPLEVPIVVRKRIKLSRAGRNIAATYEGKTIFNITNPILGNPPNAATHFRMLATIAKSPSIGPDTWVLIFEDDALLHPQIASAYPSIIERQKIIRHTFEMGTHLKADRIQYGVCKSVKGSRKETVCPAVPLSSLKGGPPLLYPDISFSTCFRGYRCAQAYAVTKRKAAQYISVYEQLNSGNTSCPRDIWSQSSPTINTALGPNAACADDPFVVNKYLAQCTGPKVGCAGLVVGDTLGMNSSTPIKATGGASQTGLFLQRANTKTRAKGHFVVRMMLMTAWVREHFGCGGKKHGCGPPAADWDPKTMLPSDRYDIEAPDLYSDE